MKIVNLKNPVMASWLREQGFRLDAPPFLSGAVEARKLLERLPVKKEPLASLTNGYNGGIYNGCLLYTSPSPRDRQKSRMPSSA